MFDSLINEEETIKMVDDSACKIINIGSINVKGKDGTLHASETVRYVLRHATI